MNYTSPKGFSGWAQLAVIVGFAGAGLIIAAVLQIVIGKSLIDPHTPITAMGEAIMTALFKPENVIYLQLSQVVGTLFLMFLPALAFSLICYGKNPLWLGFSKHIHPGPIIMGFLIIYCANIVANPAADLTKQIVSHFGGMNKIALDLEKSYDDQIVAMSNLKTWSDLAIAIVIMAFLAAVFEEMFFRGVIQNLLIRWTQKPILSIVITAFVFSLIHGSIYLFLSRAILGFALGMMYYQSKNIWVNIIAHFLNNTVAVFQLFAASHSGHKTDLSNMDQRFPLWAELSAIIILYLMFVLFKKFAAGDRRKIENDEQLLWNHTNVNTRIN